MSPKAMTSRIDEIRARVAQTAWQNRTQADRDAEYLLVLIAEAEDRFQRIAQRECEHSNHPGVYECAVHDGRKGCLGCQLRDAETERDHNAQGWRDAQELLQSVSSPCRRCTLSSCPNGCCCPCHKDSPPLNPDATYRPEPHEYQAIAHAAQRARDPSYPPPPPPPRNGARRP